MANCTALPAPIGIYNRKRWCSSTSLTAAIDGNELQNGLGAGRRMINVDHPVGRLPAPYLTTGRPDGARPVRPGAQTSRAHVSCMAGPVEPPERRGRLDPRLRLNSYQPDQRNLQTGPGIRAGWSGPIGTRRQPSLHTREIRQTPRITLETTHLYIGTVLDADARARKRKRVATERAHRPAPARIALTRRF